MNYTAVEYLREDAIKIYKINGGEEKTLYYTWRMSLALDETFNERRTEIASKSLVATTMRVF